jgi:AcrR family transcriptional regulator
VSWRTFGPLGWDPILTAALDAFVAVGYHGATVRDIARRSGLSVPGIYHHYPSKQDMLIAILDRTMADLLRRSAAARDDGAPEPVARFARLIECLALYHTYRRAPAFIGASEMRSLNPQARQRIVVERVTQQRMIDVEVEACVRAGHFRVARPHDAARAAVTMCTSIPQWYRPDGELSPERIASEYVDFAMALMRG